MQNKIDLIENSFNSAIGKFIELMILMASTGKYDKSIPKDNGVNFIKTLINIGDTGKYLLTLQHVEGEKLEYADLNDYLVKNEN